MLKFLTQKNDQKPDLTKWHLLSLGVVDEETYDYILKTYPELRKQRIREDAEDVVCIGSINNPWLSTNIDHYVGSHDQMNRGYRGTGPRTLALNILYLFSNQDKQFTEKYYNEFVEDFLLTKKQTEDLTIKKDDIHDWVDQKRTIDNLGGRFVQ